MNAILSIAPAQASVTGFVAAGLSRVEERFRAELETPIEPVNDLCRHVERYRGKMLRPTLVLLSGLAAEPAMGASPPSDDLITIATVIEMIHMATLVHDDVLDEADVRRGGDTVNKRRGNEAAVILGDYLISKSFHLCSTLDSQRTALRIGEVTSVVCEGEMLQLAHRDDYELDERTYFEIIRRKTAALIALACEQGAAAAGASRAAAERFHDFGDRIGTAFQIQDDLLDLIGQERVIGKSLGKDLEKGKLTLPVIHHLSRLPEREREETVGRLRRMNGPVSLRTELEGTGSIAYARTAASKLIDEAKSLLSREADSPARKALLAMADAVLTRHF